MPMSISFELYGDVGDAREFVRILFAGAAAVSMFGGVASAGVCFVVVVSKIDVASIGVAVVLFSVAVVDVIVVAVDLCVTCPCLFSS